METKEINRIFSRNLTFWLAERGKTQADLYKKMNVSSAIASDWCNEKKIPRADKLVIIADWLSIEISDLLEDKRKTQDNFRLSDFEKQIITSYRQADKIDKAIVLRTLNLEIKEDNTKMA